MTTYCKKIKTKFDPVVDIVARAVEQQSYAHRKVNYLSLRGLFEDDPTGLSIPENILPRDQAQDFAKRIQRCREIWGTKLEFKQNDLTADIAESVLENLPASIKNQRIQLTLQVAGPNGDFITPHKDHVRKCSLFYLFTEPDAYTYWWSKKNDFAEYDHFRYANPDDLQLEHTELIEKGQWYLFNQVEYHSVVGIKGQPVNRISFLIEFADLEADQVLELLGE